MSNKKWYWLTKQKKTGEWVIRNMTWTRRETIPERRIYKIPYEKRSQAEKALEYKRRKGSLK